MEAHLRPVTTPWRFWLFWVVAFLSFPVAGLLAKLVGAVTRGAGIDLTPKWRVFGVSGAFTFQGLTGLARSYLLRKPQVMK